MKPARLIAILFMISVLGVLVAVPVMCTSAFVHAVSSGDAIEFSSEAEFEGDPVQLGVNKLDGACKKSYSKDPSTWSGFEILKITLRPRVIASTSNMRSISFKTVL